MHPLVQLSKAAVENYLERGEVISPPENFPKKFLKKKAGTFVTIKKDGELKGCIGTYLPVQENIAKEVIRNAISAATEDYRFEPIKKEELSSLSYTIYILKEPELVKDIKKLNPKKYGVIVKSIPVISLDNGTKRLFSSQTSIKSGLLLPDLKDIDTPEKQISVACQKGGIDPREEEIIIYRFKAKKYD